MGYPVAYRSGLARSQKAAGSPAAGRATGRPANDNISGMRFVRPPMAANSNAPVGVGQAIPIKMYPAFPVSPPWAAPGRLLGFGLEFASEAWLAANYAGEWYLPPGQSIGLQCNVPSNYFRGPHIVGGYADWDACLVGQGVSALPPGQYTIPPIISWWMLGGPYVPQAWRQAEVARSRYKGRTRSDYMKMKPRLSPAENPIPAVHPAIDPMVQPIGQPAVVPNLPLPWPLLPALPPRTPWPQGRQVSYWAGPMPPSNRKPGSTTHPKTGNWPIERPRIAPAKPGTKETKTTSGTKTVMKVVNAMTEGVDAVEAVWKALPFRIRRRYLPKKGQKISISAKLRALWEHWGDVNTSAAVRNLAEDQLQDMFFGAIGRVSARASRRARPHSDVPIGYQAGGWDSPPRVFERKPRKPRKKRTKKRTEKVKR